MRHLTVLKPTATAAVVLATALALTACTYASQQLGGGGTDGASAPSFDPSTVAEDEAIAAMLPADVVADGVLTVGTETGYAPAEFIAADGRTPVGFDIDLVHALGAVLGLETEIRSSEFAGIIPAVGSQLDLGVSAFTITPERLAEANMISYFLAGSQFAVAAGNPEDVDPAAVCGLTVAVQTGTIQDEELDTLSAGCTAAGDEAIDILRYDSQADATTNLVGGKADATYADSPVIAYAVSRTGGQIETIGEVRDAAPYGVVVAKDDAELTAAVQAALQKLMDDGTLTEIFESWGNAEGVLETAELNPAG
ncbi:ABC transporter substrate-binding protein [Antribacter gilvus]|uniref:ABC transporter substrate-binding protein n=1 Tax=Antribacter gilvus TaxID=2304675 RepID=UPI000F7995F4|nr:ABC transporter substrate-binding protein [Antribacter gilvus]